MHFLAYLCHLRYQMLCVKEFCDKYKDKLNELINFDLVNIPNPSVEDQLKDFRGRFTESNQLCAEKSRNSLFERLHSALKNSIFETDKDLALVSGPLSLFPLTCLSVSRCSSFYSCRSVSSVVCALVSLQDQIWKQIRPRSLMQGIQKARRRTTLSNQLIGRNTLTNLRNLGFLSTRQCAAPRILKRLQRSLTSWE